MKATKLDHEALARDLGSTVRGGVVARSGYFGALQVAVERELARIDPDDLADEMPGGERDR